MFPVLTLHRSKSKGLTIHSNKGLMLETSAFEPLYSGHFTLSTQLSLLSYVIIHKGFVNFTNSSLSLWSVTKKKPLCTVANAHCKPDKGSDECIPDESWITSIASLRSTDLLVSGNTLACRLF